MGSFAPYGSQKDPSNHTKLIVDELAAETVQNIFHWKINGMSNQGIANRLNAKKVPSPAARKLQSGAKLSLHFRKSDEPPWSAKAVDRILHNEVYTGKLVQGKTRRLDYRSKKKMNVPMRDWTIVDNTHEAIIPKDIFLRVQEDLVRRRVVKTSANGKKRCYSCNHCFAQIVICGDCGEMFRRIHWNNRGCKSVVWRCISRLESTGLECHARTVNETILENVVVQAINTLLGDKSTFQVQLQQNIAKVIRDAQKNTADGIDEQLIELQKELLQKANSKEAYDEIADQIFQLREQREKCTVDTAARDAQIARINDLQDYIKKQPASLTDFDETLVKRWLKQIILWDDHFTVELKSGLKIDIEG